MDVSMEPDLTDVAEIDGRRLTPLSPVDNPATYNVGHHGGSAGLSGRGFSQLDPRALDPAETLPSQWYRDDR